MTRVIKAIYEKGVFRPLEKVSLPEKTEAEVIIKEKLIEENIEKLSKEVDEILKEVRIEEDPLEVLLEMRRRPWD